MTDLQGIWSGFDWSQTFADAKIVNGLVTGISEEAQRRLEAGQNLIGLVDDYMDKENVIRAKGILGETEWNNLFPNALSVYTYESFFQAMAKYPKFCGESQQDLWDPETACKRELATILAHIEHNSHKLRLVSDCSDSKDLNCGRGALLLSGGDFYRDLSRIAFNGAHHDEEVLLSNPDLVATDGRLAFLSAFQAYMQPKGVQMPSMHDTILRYYQPNDDRWCTGCFGTTINILNGNIECASWVDTTDNEERAFYYKGFMQYFGAELDPVYGESDTNMNCDGQPPMLWEANGHTAYNHIAPHWTKNKCYLVSWETEYSVYNTNDYRRCVCDKWDPTNDRCIDIDKWDPSEETEEDTDTDTDTDTETDTESETDTDTDTDDEECPSKNGIWTGVDWTDSDNNYKVVNGVLLGTTPETTRRIKSARNLPGDGSNYLDQPNVRRTKQVLTEALWDQFFPEALEVYTYENFLKAVGKFPKFCNDHKNSTAEADLLSNCKIELSTFLAHMRQEAGELIYVEEIGCSNTGYGCEYRKEDHAIYPPVYGQKYYGRGPFQLSYNYNYGQFGPFAFEGGLDDMDRLLEDPHQVATDGKLAFMSAIWFYMYPQSPKPSMHDAILGLFETNREDEKSGICSGCFATTTNIINGVQECGKENSNADRRIKFYDEYCQAFGANCPQEGKSCANQSTSFPKQGGSVRKEWLIKDDSKPNACKITQWVSGYSVYAANDYKRCVCDSWDNGNPDCLDTIEDNESCYNEEE